MTRIMTWTRERADRQLDPARAIGHEQSAARIAFQVSAEATKLVVHHYREGWLVEVQGDAVDYRAINHALVEANYPVASVVKYAHVKPRPKPATEATRPRTAAARAISSASPAQRLDLAEASIVSGQGPCDPAHIWPRGLGGCDHPLCVIPLTRAEHRAFDTGRLDLLPYLVAHKLTDNLAHALQHANGDLIALLNRVTGERYSPEPKEQHAR